jgi:DNA-binding transcriptional LysR family regulator
MGMEPIRVFCAVAQQLSFSKGAELSGITQSAASQRVRALEEEVGVLLIDRSTRPCRLTPAGKSFYRGCRRLLDRYDRLQREVAGASRPLWGHVQVAAIYSAGFGLLNRAKAEFEREHPQVKVEITYHQPQAVHDRVREEHCDLGILSYPERWPHLASIPLRDEIMAAVFRPGHRLEGRGSIQPSELAGVRLIGFDANLPISREIVRYLRGHGVQPVIESYFDNIDTVKSTLIETDAVAILPSPTVQVEAERGDLLAVELRPLLVRPLAIMHRRDREFPPVVEEFIELMLGRQSPERGPSSEDRSAA